MDFHWAAGIALWTILSGPILSPPMPLNLASSPAGAKQRGRGLRSRTDEKTKKEKLKMQK
jgi:hypothetical protein